MAPSLTFLSEAPMQNAIKTLSDSQLLSTLQKLNDREHEATLQILLYLIEVENRRLYAEEGYSSQQISLRHPTETGLTPYY